MSLNDYYSLDGTHLKITPDQASNFAKAVAGDFNPLHDADNRRFCVPGDLLFTILLQRYGINQDMRFKFSGMVGDGDTLVLEDDPGDKFDLRDTDGKAYLSVERSGDISHEQSLIERLACSYVTFSGHNFPHIMVPLMQEQGAMINVDRPMVIYESMAFKLERLDIPNVELRLASSSMKAEGRRGEVLLNFEFLCGDTVVGAGCKRMVLGGLKPYEQEGMDRLVSAYLGRRDSYEATTGNSCLQGQAKPDA